MQRFCLGLDVGSISVNTVLIDPGGRVVENRYDYCHGRPFHTLLEVLDELLSRHPADTIERVATTGSGGALAARLLGGHFVNEIVAQSTAVGRLYPHARTVIEMGGEDSKLILMERTDGESGSRLADFVMNTVCAAGTGSFLDQQARRLGVSIEKEFGELALRSQDPPRIAGRCSVFAKSDMIHLQQIATPVHDIVAGLCFAVARNLRSNLARGRRLASPVVFQGGVAANAGVVRAFREILSLEDGQLIIPEYHASMGAIGAVFHLRDNPPEPARTFAGTEELERYLQSDSRDLSSLEALHQPQVELCKRFHPPSSQAITEVYLGVDVGSLSTNVVLIDGEDNVVARRYLPTAGRPLEAIRRGLEEIHAEVGDRVTVRAAGTTGSGRYLTGDFIGADTIQNEITAQATGAVHFDPNVDTVFEIGGQDSKYISIDNGVVVDFEMNKVCAAGTGSFLEEQAEKLGINIVEEFGDIALHAARPSRLGDRCTVFMESDLNAHQQKGAVKESLVAGLAYSIVLNYIQKVVGAKRIGDHILFQGGVANNRAVIAAFERITGKKITVPPHFDVTGAIGAGMLARAAVRSADGGCATTRFKGFQVSQVPYALDRFACSGCANQCEIRRVRIEGEKRPLFYGGRCEKYERDDRKARHDLPNLFERRLELLLGDYQDAAPAGDSRPTVGIPRGLMVFYQQFPFWRTFFEEIGFRVVLSRPSDRRLVARSLELLTAETCFPVEVMHGHIHDLLDYGPDYVFTPFVVDAAAGPENPTINYNCPWVQSYPFMVRGAVPSGEGREKILVPTLHFRYSRSLLKRELVSFARSTFGTPARQTSRAFAAAERARKSFEATLREEGRKVLESLCADRKAFVVLGRPYNTCDPELNLGLVQKLINLGALPIPVDFLPLESVDIFGDYPMMYWPNGQKILAAARLVARDERLHAVCLSNFRCGPDSFILHYIREEMRGKPYLQLEVDEHSADAGMITRCEAFLDSLRGGRKSGRAREIAAPVEVVRATPSEGRVLYFPYMADSAYILAAASRACGIPSEVLPMQDEADLELGRQFTSSRECFPMICTTGSFLKKLGEQGADPSTMAFFMPAHGGPCRFGQYHKLQRLVLRDLGFGEAEIVSPSNKNSYADFTRGMGVRFRLLVWKGMVASDILAKLRQERRPYEARAGETETVYQAVLAELARCIESGGRDVLEVLRRAVDRFAAVKTVAIPRKPVVAVVGEIFMRDNPFCSGFLVRRLEELGAETVMAPVREWIASATARYAQESLWRREPVGALKAVVQGYFQDRIAHDLEATFHHAVEMQRMIPVERMFELCSPYIHPDYVGDPPLAFGAAAGLVPTGISGVANLLPFTCLPGTIIASISSAFRRDHGDLPWVDIAYDGQEDTGLETRLQAFVHQARQYSRKMGHDRVRSWGRAPGEGEPAAAGKPS